MNYKVGDKVRIIDHRGKTWNNKGKMDHWMGKKMTIRKICGSIIWMEEDKNENVFGGWWWGKSDFVPLHDQKIVITTDGTTTLARLYENDKVVKRAEARCNPEDEFDFKTGADLAYNRLMDEKKQEESPFYTGKVVCLEDAPGYTKNKVYEFVNGRTIDDDGDIRPTCEPVCYTSERIEKAPGIKFVKLVEEDE